MAKAIDSKTYNKITGLCDQLVLLNNSLAGQEEVRIYWDVNCEGIFSMCIGRVVDGTLNLSETMTMWFFFDDPEERYDEMIDTIHKWEEAYGLQSTKH